MSTQPTELARIIGAVDYGLLLDRADATVLLVLIEEQAKEIKRLKAQIQTYIEYGVQEYDRP